MLLLVCLYAHSAFVCAQQNAPTPKSYKWDLSTDLMWVTGKNTYPPSLMIRRTIHPNQAIRLRMGFSLDDKDNLDQAGNSTNLSRNLNQTTVLLSALGFEKRTTLSSKLRLNYGVDLGYRYFHSNVPQIVPVPFLDSDPNSVKYALEHGEVFTVTEYSITTWSMACFGGIQYLLSPRLSFSMESNLMYSFEKRRSGSNDLSAGLYNANFKRFKLSPISTINIHFHF